MNKIKERIEKLSYDDVIRIIEDYEQFEKDGFIGDCLLRKTAEDIGVDGNIIFWMERVALEAYRYVANLERKGRNL